MVAFSAFGCDHAEYVIDAGELPDAEAPLGRIVVESPASFALAFGQSADIAILYTEADVPRAAAPVRFALEGRAHDSSLAALEASTDGDGRVRTSVTAGSTAAAFRVRVSAAHAAAAYVNVSVGAEGFGTLVVSAPYDGRRGDGAHRVVHVYSEADCRFAGGVPPFPDRAASLEDSTTDETRFRALPAGLRYAVVGRVEGPAGVALATACADGIALAADREVRVALEFHDAALVLTGRYDHRLSLSTVVTGRTFAEAQRAGGYSRIAAAGSESAFYLDALDAELRAQGESAAAEALAVERHDGEQALGDALRQAVVGPSQALMTWTDRLKNRLSHIAIEGPLELAAGPSATECEWRIEALELGAAAHPDLAPLPVDAEDLGLAPALAATWSPDRDALTLDALSLPLHLGTLAHAAVEADAAARAQTPLEMFAERAGCDVLGTWIAARPSVAAGCGPSCARAACERALSELTAAMEDASESAGDRRDEVVLSRTDLTVADEDADLAIDRIEGTGRSGVWVDSGATAGDLLTADFVASRAPD